jgi:hypothetical protein
MIRAAFVALAGCSLLSVPMPHTPRRDEHLYCSYAAPIADTVGGVLFGLPTLYEIANYNTHSDGFSPSSVWIDLVTGGFTALYTASAVYGYLETARCNQLKDAGPPPTAAPALARLRSN